jgi:hypothetical protein
MGKKGRFAALPLVAMLVPASLMDAAPALFGALICRRADDLAGFYVRRMQSRYFCQRELHRGTMLLGKGAHIAGLCIQLRLLLICAALTDPTETTIEREVRATIAELVVLPFIAPAI